MNFSKIFILKFFLCYLAAWLLLSCSNEDDTMVLLQDNEYLPLQVGNYQVYDVTETTYTNGTGVTQAYELRTEVVDSFPAIDGFYTYVIYRSTRASSTEEWDYINTWSATFTNREAIVQEENISFVKLDLPIVKDAKWDGNLYNTLGEDEYTFASMPVSFVAGVLSFDNVIEVVQNNDLDNIVGNDIRKEFYARGVGLIQKSYEVVEYCTVGACLGQQEIKSGLIRTQVIKEHGRR